MQKITLKLKEILRTKASMMKELNRKYGLCDKWLKKIERTGDLLPEILALHKRMWKMGLQCRNFGPDKYGMFRTDDIAEMTMEQVFLGDVDGLWTNTAAFWEQDKNTAAGTPDHYVRVCRQYRDLLVSNLKAMRAQIFDGGFSREKMSRNIIDGFSLMRRASAPFHDVDIISASLAQDQILRCRLIGYGKEVLSSCLLLGKRILLPEGFEKGVNLTAANAAFIRFMDPLEALNRNGNAVFKLLTGAELELLKNIPFSSTEFTRRLTKKLLENVRRMESDGYRFGL